MNIAIIGASNNKSKFGNKAVRAYLRQGHTVYPVNQMESEIEGLKVYKSILDIPDTIDRVSLYLPPHIGISVLDEIAQKGIEEIFINPGAESRELLDKAEQLGLNTIIACSIIDIGEIP